MANSKYKHCTNITNSKVCCPSADCVTTD